jgi:hypothetical protein
MVLSTRVRVTLLPEQKQPATTEQQQQQHLDMYANPHYRPVTDVAEQSRLCWTEPTKTHPTPWLLVRKRTIPTERPPLVSEVSANFCG